ncbi:MAG: ABC transporter permease [Phycisphaerae bacterium]
MSTLRRALPAYWRMSVAGMLQYRASIALWAVWGVVYPTVALVVWGAAQRSSEQAEIGGYDAHEFAAYFLLTMVISHVTAAWDLFEMGWLVRSGGMSPRLLRPILPLWTNVTDNLAYKVVTLTMLVPIWLIVAWAAQPRFHTTTAHLGLGIAALTLAAALNFILGYALALVAFWTTRIDGLAGAYFGASLMFGGRFAPLSVLPAAIAWIPELLPFKWITWFPAEVLAGRLPLAHAGLGLLAQLGWLAFSITLFKVLWPAALKRYSAVGA